MVRKSKKSSWALFFGALSDFVGVIIGLIGRGFFFGLGFWWAFLELMK